MLKALIPILYNDEFIYTSNADQIDHWSKSLGCDLNEPIEIVDTPHSGGIYDLVCRHRKSCNLVMWCDYNGFHGTNIWQQPNLQTWFVYEYLQSSTNMISFSLVLATFSNFVI